jgi:aminoglycoside phosphotransferase (APT) family kinase protein
LVQVDGRHGIFFRRVHGAPMMARVADSPESMEEVGNQLAALHATIHQHDAPALRTLHDYLTGAIERAAIDDTVRAEALRRLALLPTGDRLLHMDFHPMQVIEEAGGPVIVDWLTAVQGDPAADVARTALLLTVAKIDDPGFAWLDRGFRRSALAHRYVNEYCRRTGMAPAQIDAWFYPLAAARRSETTDDNPMMLTFLSAGAISGDDSTYLMELSS